MYQTGTEVVHVLIFSCSGSRGETAKINGIQSVAVHGYWNNG
jgi:hypothetical protein